MSLLERKRSHYFPAATSQREPEEVKEPTYCED